MKIRRLSKANAQHDDSIARRREGTRSRVARTGVQAVAGVGVGEAVQEGLEWAGWDFAARPAIGYLLMVVGVALVSYTLNKVEDLTGMTLPGVLGRNDGDHLELGAPRSTPDELPETRYPPRPGE